MHVNFATRIAAEISLSLLTMTNKANNKKRNPFGESNFNVIV